MNNVMKALNLIEMHENIYQDYGFFDDVSDRLMFEELVIEAMQIEIMWFKQENNI